MTIAKAFYDQISSSGGGSTPSDKGQFVELLDNTTTTFPTTRKDGTALQDRDYCVVSSASSVIFPFDVSYVVSGTTYTLTITENQKGFIVQYYNGAWVIQAGLTVESNEIVIDNRQQESISGDAIYQNQANKQFAECCKEVLNKQIKNGTDTSTIITKDSQNKDTLRMHLTAEDGSTLAHSTYNFNDNLVLENKTQTLANKTINADDNTLSNLTSDNLKRDAFVSDLPQPTSLFAWEDDDNGDIYYTTVLSGTDIDVYKSSFVKQFVELARISNDKLFFATGIKECVCSRKNDGDVNKILGLTGKIIDAQTIVNYTDDLADKKQDIIQVRTMPTADASWLDKVIQYIGSDAGYGYTDQFYRCVYQNDRYTWNRIFMVGKTNLELVAEPANESISGASTTQRQVNIENVVAIKNTFQKNISIYSLSSLNTNISTLFSAGITKATVEITQEFSNNYTPEFTFKKGEALMTIASATSAQIIGYNFSARLVDGNWIGENNDYIEQLNFSMVPGGFDYILDLTVNPDLQSTDIIIDLKQNEELILDFGENWQDLTNKTVYWYRQPFQFLINGQIKQRFYVYKNQAGRYRLATSTNLDAPNLIKIYKRKNTNWMPTQLNNVKTFQNSSLRVYGDSITIGATNTSDVVNPTFSQLFASRVGVNSFINRAVSGTSWTAITGRTRLLTTLQTYLRKPNEGETTDYNIGNLFLNCGINDYAEQIDLNTFRLAVQETLDYVLAHILFTRVFIISPFNIDNTGTYGNKTFTVDMYREVLQQEAERYGFYYINGANFPLPIMADSYIYSDGLHLKQLGHTLIGQKLIEMLTKNYLADADKYLTHVNTDRGLANTGKTTIDGKPIYKFSYSTKSVAYYSKPAIKINPNNLIAILAHNGITCTKTYLLNAYGYSSDSNYRIPLNWLSTSGGTVNYSFTAHLSTNGTIVIHFPNASYQSEYEITFEFWAE